jgi:hypothetical protein
MIANRIGTWIPPENAHTCCPPGELEPVDGVAHVVVATLMRSGTHLLIDLLLNNFPKYRKRSLYVNMDRFIRDDHLIDQLLAAGGQVLKTHYPQIGDSDSNRVRVLPILARSRVILVERDREDIRRSMARFGDWGTQQLHDLDAQFDRFDAFWDQRDDGLRVHFDDLIDPVLCARVLDRLSSFLDLRCSTVPVFPRPKAARNRVYLDKLMTRLVGRSAPRVNTTIGFSI